MAGRVARRHVSTDVKARRAVSAYGRHLGVGGIDLGPGAVRSQGP